MPMTMSRCAALTRLARTAAVAGLFCLAVAAQTTKLSFAHLSVADGLSQSDVRAIVQDRQGFMWFGTWLGGLNRYDGYAFKVYKHDDQDERSLGCDSIWALYVDRAGVLWVGTNEGVDRYDQNTDSFVHYRHRTNDPTSLPSYKVMSFFEDESGTFWIGSSGGLSRFDRTSGRFFTYTRKPNDPATFGDTVVRSICQDRTTGLLWLAAGDNGVSVLDRSTGHYTRYTNDPNDPGSLSSNDVSHIFQDRQGTLWVSTQHALNRFDPKTHTFIRYLHDPGNPASLGDDYVQMTYEDRVGRFWVATSNGLNLMDRSHATFIHYMHDPNDASSRSDNVTNPRAMYEDASGALWIGMRSTGVDRLPGAAPKFTTYRHNPRDLNTLSGNTITTLAIDSSGALWIGTDAGLDRFDGRNFTHYIANRNDPAGLSPGPERSVARDSHGALWTGTYGGGLDRLDGRRVKHFRHDPGNSDSPANDNISSLVPDAKGGLWIGVHGKGIDYFDGRHFMHFPSDPAYPATAANWSVRPLLLDPRGMLWITTSSFGLVRLDTNTRKFTTYLLDPNQPGNQAANWTEDVYSDGASIWVGSPAGLFRFDPEAGTFTRHYTEKDGLANTAVAGILGDARGKIWVSTLKGLSRFDPKTETFRNYDAFDGLQANEFSLRCRAKAADGRLFVGGVNGLSAFYPDRLTDNPAPPPVVLTDFELFNKPVKIGGTDSPLREAIHVASNVVLRHDQSVFRFQFAALDFTAPQKNRYAYKLEGFDRDWQYTDATRRFATYTNLSHGDYTLRVKASNNDGVWNEQGVALHIRILPPWWKTWYFRALASALVLLSIWCAYQLRVRELRREFDAQLDGRVEERTRLARDLHDTLLQTFQAALIQTQSAYNLFSRRPEKALETLQNAIGISAGAIAEGREAIQNMRSSTVTKNDLAQALRVAGDQMAAGGSATFDVRVQGPSRDVHPILRDEVYRISLEALRNAFQHAEAKAIEAEILYGDSLRVRIRDDGKGIAPAIMKGGRSGHYGLPGMRERAERVGGKLEVWSGSGAGTEIQLSIPGTIAFGTSGVGSLFRRIRRKGKSQAAARG